MQINRVTLHLSVVSQNKAGTVFVNAHARVIVLRLERVESLATVVEIAEQVLAEMLNAGADTLIFDMRRICNAEEHTAVLIARLMCLSSGLVRRYAKLTLQSLDFPPHQEIADAVKKYDIKFFIAKNFEDAAVALDNVALSEDSIAIDQSHKKENYLATYAGICYSLPELSTTVLRTSGNVHENALLEALFEHCFALHRTTAAATLIVDSSSTPPVTEMARYLHVYKTIIVPIGTSGFFKQVVHVRAGDPLFAESAPPVAPLATSFGVLFYEVALFSDAISLVRALQGKPKSALKARFVVPN